MPRRKNINQEENLSRQFSVSITPQYMEKLAALCKKERRKRGAMVRIMIEEWFEDREREREMETKGKRIARGMEREKRDSYYE
jgi:mRNA-degrading endonuclease RelE of RelBE toxin-antitoxin system